MNRGSTERRVKPEENAVTTPIDLADYRRRVAELYFDIRCLAVSDPAAAWHHFRQGRDALFAGHPQTALTTDQRAGFSGLPYYPYNPAARVIASLEYAVKPELFEVELPDDGRLRYTRIARAHFAWAGRPAALSLFWIEGYGGGLFLPFRDQTCGQSSYGGGRYLYDTIKGADLGVTPTKIPLDFNFAYNPSCAYNARWVCPLAPEENRLDFAVEAGEKEFEYLGNWEQGTGNGG